jgi:hypothetical protein
MRLTSGDARARQWRLHGIDDLGDSRGSGILGGTGRVRCHEAETT